MKTKTPKTLIKNIPQIIGYFSQVSTRFNFGVELLHGSIFEDEDALFEVVYPPDLNPAIPAQRLFSVYNEITKSDKWLAPGVMNQDQKETFTLIGYSQSAGSREEPPSEDDIQIGAFNSIWEVLDKVIELQVGEIINNIREGIADEEMETLNDWREKNMPGSELGD